jgi:two-component SAPR family response regulator
MICSEAPGACQMAAWPVPKEGWRALPFGRIWRTINLQVDEVTGAAGSELTILIVDDDALVRDSVVSIVAAQGFRVLAAGSTVEAMGILAREHVDLLFTDIVMPGQDGIELAREAKKLRPRLRILFSTGYFSRANDAIGLGELLFKPMRAHQIETAVAQALRGLGN